MIPEQELLHPLTGQTKKTGESIRTALPWLFLCGNARTVHDLIDEVTGEARLAGLCAAAYTLKGDCRTGWTADLPTISRAGDITEAGQLRCLGCPRDCVLLLDGETVSGAQCEKGAAYIRQEMASPARYLTATVAVNGGRYPRLPVRTREPVMRSCFPAIMQALQTLRVELPVRLGQVILHDTGLCGCEIIASREMVKWEKR